MRNRDVDIPDESAMKNAHAVFDAARKYAG
jgi:hypothetical protein